MISPKNSTLSFSTGQSRTLTCFLTLFVLKKDYIGAAQNPLNEIAEKTPQNEGYHCVSSGQTGVITL
jgi:hypothetical protein